jgi:hypothetical protein
MASSNPPPVVVNMTHPNPHVAVNMSPPLKRVNMKSMFAKTPVPRSNAANVFSRNPTNTAITVKARGGKRRSTRRRLPSRSKSSKKRRSQ